MKFHWQSPARYPQDLKDIFFELFRKVGISIDFMLNQSEVEEKHSSCQRKESLRKIWL